MLAPAAACKKTVARKSSSAISTLVESCPSSLKSEHRPGHLAEKSLLPPPLSVKPHDTNEVPGMGMTSGVQGRVFPQKRGKERKNLQCYQSEDLELFKLSEYLL